MTAWKSKFEFWSFWIDYKAVSGDIIKNIPIDDYFIIFTEKK